MKLIDLSGSWTCEIPGCRAPVHLPGTLDESGIGFPDDPEKQWKAEEVRRIGLWKPGDPIVTRLTRLHSFEGAARISRTVDWEVSRGSRVFLEVERARSLRLWVNGREAPPVRPASLSTPWVFEVTDLVTGRDHLLFVSDNSYPGWPRDAIVYSSAASDETQTNWNGLLGYVRLRVESADFLSEVRVYPRGRRLDVRVRFDFSRARKGILCVSSPALREEYRTEADIPRGSCELSFPGLALSDTAERWDLEEGHLHPLTVSFLPGDSETDPPSGLPGDSGLSRTVSFGIRDFAVSGGRLALNGRPVFLRSEANCAVFPETGYCPTDAETWKAVLRQYRAYGVNCMRFHSHCPPEAAFTAADELGLLMQPELSHWDPAHAFASDGARRYYRTEFMEILRHLANHPSFVMLTLGNELAADESGHAFMDELLRDARAFDPTRLYANGSNTHYGERGADPGSDFYTSQRFRSLEMRATCDGMTGWLNHEPPNSRHDYAPAVAALRETCGQPVFSFEVGQYEVLPDFGEIEEYRGVTRAENLRQIRRKVRESGLEADWASMVRATGENSLQCYRAEVEAALRTPGYSGISLLGLQDFPGQGTALVGMMDAHLRPKPFDFARPERFAAFFRDVLPLVLLDRFTYTAGETLTARVRIANYGKKDLRGFAEWELRGGGTVRGGVLSGADSQPGNRDGSPREVTAPAGGLTDLGEIRLPLEGIEKPLALTLAVRFCGAENEYPLWVYPDAAPVCPDGVWECRALDDRARRVLENGGAVYLAPDSTAEAIPRSLPAQFSPDFWSVCTFPYQSGCMGQLIDENHPIFRNFPTESWSTWQWWPMANQRAMLLPGRIETIIAEMDSYAYLRPMAQLFECRCGNGRLLVSSLGLHRLTEYPEARALQRAVYAYLSSDLFRPAQRLSEDWIRKIMENE